MFSGCGEKDLIDDNLPSQDQARSLIEQFQAATAADDDEAACELMDEDMQSNSRPAGVLGQLGRSCSLDGAFWNPREKPSPPRAEIVYITISRHDDTADVQLDNGTRFFLRRAGTNADGEWRISQMGYRPSPEDWSRRLHQPNGE